MVVGRSVWAKLSDSIPKIFDIEISTPTGRRLNYRYELIVLSTSTDDLNSVRDDSVTESAEESQFSWKEHCQFMDGEKESCQQSLKPYPGKAVMLLLLSMT